MNTTRKGATNNFAIWSASILSAKVASKMRTQRMCALGNTSSFAIQMTCFNDLLLVIERHTVVTDGCLDASELCLS